MTDVRLGSEISIEAPVHTVFEYCRDPRRIYAEDPLYRVADTTMAPEGVGTRIRVVATFGILTEDVAIEYVEFVPDQRIVFTAAPRDIIAGLGSFGVDVFTWTWTFAPEDGRTRLSLLVVQRDVPWWERLLAPVWTRLLTRRARGLLGRIKAAVEEEIVPAR